MSEIRLHQPSSLRDQVASAIDCHGRPLFALFTTYTFNPHWFAAEFFPLLCGDTAEEELGLGLQVVCDVRNYPGHTGGPWVKLWPGGQLFHPKIALLVFRDATLLFAGSANLTPQGHRGQIEAIGMESWGHQGLPQPLVPLCRQLATPLADRLLLLRRLASERLVFSLGLRFSSLFDWSRADEIIVVSPFFDREEPDEPASEAGYLLRAIKAAPSAKITVIAPLEIVGGSDKQPFVMYLPPSLKAVAKGRLHLYGVDPEAHEERSLHAKVIALRRGDRADVLIGSANATSAAMEGGNVEAGWFGGMRFRELTQWLRQQELLSNRLDPATCRFLTPPSRVPLARCPLLAARWDEASGCLHLDWMGASNLKQLDVLYQGRPVRVTGNRVRRFVLRRDWFLVVRRDRPRTTWHVPIEVTCEIGAPRRAFDDTATDPAALLRSLVSLPPEIDPWGDGATLSSSTSKAGSGSPSTDADKGDAEALFDRVRLLGDGMAVARQALDSEDGTKIESTIALLVRIARAHDPAAHSLNAAERLWRYWVRAEVAALVRHAPDCRARRRMAQVVRHLLNAHALPSHLRAACREIRREVVR
jgi:hypothetical protein